MKRVVSIQDISCLGRCSLTVALPVISAMGVECAIVPTAVLSTHTAFPGFTCKDLTDQLPPIARHWRSQNVAFDAISTGYIASAPQTRQVLDFVAAIRRPGTLLVVDPAMADHGKLYAGFDDDFPKAMAQVVAQADVALPNITEACLLTGTPYREDMDEFPLPGSCCKRWHRWARKGWCSPVRPSRRTSWALWATTALPARTLHVSARGIPHRSTARGYLRRRCHRRTGAGHDVEAGRAAGGGLHAGLHPRHGARPRRRVVRRGVREALPALIRRMDDWKAE